MPKIDIEDSGWGVHSHAKPGEDWVGIGLPGKGWLNYKTRREVEYRDYDDPNTPINP